MHNLSVSLPYGKSSLQVDIPERNFAGEIQVKDLPMVASPTDEVRRAMQNPIECQRLSEMVDPEDEVVIVVTDMTRRSPDAAIMDVVLEELHIAGVRNENITAVTALGIHRPMTPQEIEEKIGNRAFTQIRTLNHNCHDQENMVNLGKTKNVRAPIKVNKTVVEADFVITTGVVEIHTFAGYSGDGKSIMPGVSGEEAIAETHRPVWIDHPKVGIGVIDGNPIHEDIVETARKVGVDFIVNAVLNSKDEPVRVAAGDMEKAHRSLICSYDDMYKAEISEPVDIVISCPGYPKDINLYQATRAANNFVLVPKPAVKRGGTIIIPAPCQDGVGDDFFSQFMISSEHPRQIIEEARERRELGIHKPYIMAKILMHADVIVAGCQVPDLTIRKMHMIPMKTVEEAIEFSLKKHGPDSRILVAPHGFSSIPVLSKP